MVVNLGGGDEPSPEQPEWIWAEDYSEASAVFPGDDTEEDLVLPAVVSSERTEPDCTTPGQEVYTATVVYEGHTFTDVQYVTLDALGHDWDEGTELSAVSCTSAGVIVYTCQRCGETRTEATEALGHDPQPVEAVEPSCTEPGNTAGTICARCGAILDGVEELLPTGHTVEIDEGVNPSCTESGISSGAHCAVCGEVLVEQEELEPLGHDAQPIPAVEPSCTESGLTEGSVCARCGEILVEQEVVEALGHDLVIVPGVEPSCTQAGLTDGVSCARCGEVFAVPEVVNPLGHDPELIPGIAPTCTEPGLSEGSICARCGEILFEQEELEPLGHDIVVIPGKEPSCTMGGYTESSYCARCGEILTESEELPPAGHSYGEPSWIWSDDCSLALASFVCSSCGDSRLLIAEITEEIVKPATETEDGERKLTATVVLNGETYTDEKLLPIEKSGHDCQIAQFEDVMEAYPFGTPEHEAIEWAFTSDPKITSGISETAFGVGKTVTRRDAMTFLWIAAGKPKPTLTESPFTDVTNPEAYYYDAVLWAFEKGITSGVSATEFGGKKTLTRREMITFLYKQQGEPAFDESMENPYSDVGDGWYKDAILWAYDKGIDRGADGKFDGKAPCTRETVVLWLYRTLTGNALAQ